MTPNQIKALRFASDVFSDEVRMAPEIAIEHHLPLKHRHHYDEAFYKRMAGMAASAIEKMSGHLVKVEAETKRLAEDPTAPGPDHEDYWDYWEFDSVLHCSCVAEEMMLNALVSEAFVYLGDPGEFSEMLEFSEVTRRDQDRGYVDLIFYDMDFLDLYDPSMDGFEREDTVIAQQLGLTNLEFKDWFEPFNSTCTTNGAD